jgi:hypothetical protein
VPLDPGHLVVVIVAVAWGGRERGAAAGSERRRGTTLRGEAKRCRVARSKRRRGAAPRGEAPRHRILATSLSSSSSVGVPLHPSSPMYCRGVPACRRVRGEQRRERGGGEDKDKVIELEGGWMFYKC